MVAIALMLVLSGIVYGVQVLSGQRRDGRAALRYGMAGGFLFTGVDHFISAQTRYVPMMPDFLADMALPLVWFTGIAELAGAMGLLVPLSVYQRLGLPNLRRWAGMGLALLLASVVIANINVAIQGGQVEGLNFGLWYFWLRPLLQPVLIVWALYASEAWTPRSRRLRPRYNADNAS